MVIARVLAGHGPTTVLTDYEKSSSAAQSVLDRFESERTVPQKAEIARAKAEYESMVIQIGIFFKSVKTNLGPMLQVTSVSKGDSADRADIRKGDLIQSFNNTPTTEKSHFFSAMRDCRPGTTADVRVLRDGVARTVTLPLAGRSRARTYTFEEAMSLRELAMSEGGYLAPRDEAPAFALAAAAPQVLAAPDYEEFFPEPGVDKECLYSKFKSLSEFLRPEIEAHVCSSENRSSTHIPSKGLASAHLDSPDTLVMLWKKTKLPLPRGVTSLMLDAAVHEQEMDTLEQLGHWLHVWERDSLADNSLRRGLAYVGFNSREVDLALADAAMEETQLDQASAELAWGLHHRNDGLDRLIRWVHSYRGFVQSTQDGRTSVVEALRALKYPPFLVRACVRQRFNYGRVKDAINLETLDACIDWINAENTAYRRALAKQGATKMEAADDKQYAALIEKAKTAELRDTRKQRKKDEKAVKKESRKAARLERKQPGAAAAAQRAAAEREEQEMAMVRARIAEAKRKEEQREFAHLSAPDEQPHLAALTRGHLLAADDPVFEPPLLQTREQYNAQFKMDEPTPAPHLQPLTHVVDAPMFNDSPNVLGRSRGYVFGKLARPSHRGSMLTPITHSHYLGDDPPEDLCGLRDRLLRECNQDRVAHGLPEEKEEEEARVFTWRAGHGARAQGEDQYRALLEKARAISRPSGMTWDMVQTSAPRMHWRSLNDVHKFTDGWAEGGYHMLPLDKGMGYLGYPDKDVQHALFRMGSTTKATDRVAAQKMWRERNRRDPYDRLIAWLSELEFCRSRCAQGESTTVEALRRLGYPAGLVDQVAKGPASKRRTLDDAIAAVEHQNKILNAFIKKKGHAKMEKMSSTQYAQWFAKIEKQEAKKEKKQTKKEAKKEAKARRRGGSAYKAEQRRRSEAERNRSRVGQARQERDEEAELRAALQESMRQFEEEKRAREEKMKEQQRKLDQEREEEEARQRRAARERAEQLEEQREKAEREKREREERLREEKARADRRLGEHRQVQFAAAESQAERRQAADEAAEMTAAINAYISRRYRLGSEWGIGFAGPRVFFKHHSARSTQWDDPRMTNWVELRDPRNGRTYYQNNVTRETTYTDPRGVVPLPSSQEELDRVIAEFIAGRGRSAEQDAQEHAAMRRRSLQLKTREQQEREAAERQRKQVELERQSKFERELREREEQREREKAAEKAKLAAVAKQKQEERDVLRFMQELNDAVNKQYALPADWGVAFQGNRLLFLNHASKKTQWEDPRLQGWVQLVDPRNGRPYWQNNISRTTTYDDPRKNGRVPQNPMELERFERQFMARYPHHVQAAFKRMRGW